MPFATNAQGYSTTELLQKQSAELLYSALLICSIIGDCFRLTPSQCQHYFLGCEYP